MAVSLTMMFSIEATFIGTPNTANCVNVPAGSLEKDPAMRNDISNAGSPAEDPAGTVVAVVLHPHFSPTQLLSTYPV